MYWISIKKRKFVQSEIIQNKLRISEPQTVDDEQHNFVTETKSQPPKKNKIAQGDVSIYLVNWQFFFFYRKYLFDRQNIVKFVIYGSKLVEIDTLLVQFKRNSKIWFLAAILSFFRKRG